MLYMIMYSYDYKPYHIKKSRRIELQKGLFMKVSLTGIQSEELAYGLKDLLAVHGFIYTDEPMKSTYKIECRKIDDNLLQIKKNSESVVIAYKEKAHFFRGVSLFLQYIDKPIWEMSEVPSFDSNGIMLDCSRNCVPRVETIKKYIVRLAELGMNRLYLYMEDTLEIEGYPYWGYLRGRYKKEEMIECDRYAKAFGITLVPCIQTLAHLKNVLKQPMFKEYKDIDDILLLDSEKTRELLRALLETVQQCFSGHIVHLGMDEAANLGRGRYMDIHGSTNPATIMKTHLEWLAENCRQLGLSPIIWSDMYLKFNFGADNYYGLSKDAEIINSGDLPSDITLCYWDYYNEGVDFYDQYIKHHKKLGCPLVFAGGAWTWSGMAPNISKALKISREALEACRKNDVRDVFCTAWMDNGAETPQSMLLPALAWYGEYGFCRNPKIDSIKERFEFCFGKNWNAYMLLDAFDNPNHESGGHNRYSVNPSKTILYEDNMMGLLSKMFDENQMKARYEMLVEKLGLMLESSEKMDEEDRGIFAYYKVLAQLLSRKAGITERLKNAYAIGDREVLLSIAKNDLEEIALLAEELRVKRQDIWMCEYKPFGYEIIDIRLGGVVARAKSAASRIRAYVDGRLDAILELEEEILPYKSREMLEKEFLHGYYMWEKLISACNIDGI